MIWGYHYFRKHPYPKTSPNIPPKSASHEELHEAPPIDKLATSTSINLASSCWVNPIEGTNRSRWFRYSYTKKQPYSKTITFQWFYWYPGRPWETFCDLLLTRFLLEKDSFKESQPRLSTSLRSTSQCTCEPGPAFFFKQLLNSTLLNDWWGDKTRYWYPRDTMRIRDVAWSSLREIPSCW